MTGSKLIWYCTSITCLLFLPVLHLMRGDLEAYNEEGLSEVPGFNRWIECFYFLFWSFTVLLLSWHSWKHLLQRWGFPLFRILISLESAMGWIRRLTTDSRMIDVTLSYNL